MKFSNDKLAIKISNLILKTQNRFAACVSKLVARFSALSMKLILIAVSIIFVSLNVWFIVDALTGIKSKPIVSNIRIISLKKEEKQSSIILTVTAYKKIQLFKSYMDSLHQNNKTVFDSIMKARPGILDSISILEKIYLSQSNK